MTKKKKPTPKPKKNKFLRKLNRYLTVVLNDAQTIDRSRTMVMRSKDLEDLEAEKAAKVRDYGEQIKTLAGEISRYAQVIRDGKEQQQVECKEELDYENRQIVVTRLDTDEVVDKRSLTQDEKEEFFQEKLFPDGTTIEVVPPYTEPPKEVPRLAYEPGADANDADDEDNL